ncbi:hypothetical protein PVAND_007214 [Polypedilum vanderplanki]|uniref:RNA helicase n=1 Tax=Polypedilum vanderplanki TaxID=319348 RepID=A0A9J6C6I1_POLVA|nr:hypothetical protein PVAND_007214 [Polypedilum vanderplanki]
MESHMKFDEEDPTIYSNNNKIFLYGNEISEPLMRLDDLKFARNIRENFFKKGFRSIFPIQNYSWNEILKRHSILMIGPRYSGTTIAYIPSLLTLLLKDIQTQKIEDEEVYDDNENKDKEITSSLYTSQGPLAIIFAKSSREVELIRKLCVDLSKSSLKIVAASGIWNLTTKKIELLNGCDLLITTLPCFKRLDDCDIIKIFDRNKIRYIVLDGFDFIYEKFDKEVIQILKSFYKYDSIEENKLQFIITATKWDEVFRVLYMQSFIKIILIDNFIEAAIMARTRFQIVIEDEHAKDLNLLKRLKSNEWRQFKTLILFNQFSELVAYKKFIKDEAPEISIISIESIKQKKAINELCLMWQQESKGRMTLLLMTDEVYQIHCAIIERVQVIIHYSLSPSWTKFCRRFGASIDHYKKFVEKNNQPTEEERPVAIILLNDDNVREFSRLLHFLQDRRLIKQLSNEMHQKVMRIKETVERSKMKNDEEIFICQNFLKFADSSNDCDCNQRHGFTNRDINSFLLKSGYVKFLILDIFNPLHYTIKITHTRNDLNSSWISQYDKIEQTEIALKELQLYMNNKENEKTAAVIKIGELYCIKNIPTHNWYRCKVIFIGEKSDISPTYDVIVSFIDKSGKKMTKSIYVRELPEKFKKYDPLATELRIINMTPYDFDKHFDYETTNEVANEICRITRNQNNKDYFVCKIDLTAANTIFSENFQYFHFMKELNLDKFQFSLRQYLLENNFAMKNENIFDKIKSNAVKAGLILPVNTVTKDEKAKGVVNDQKIVHIEEETLKDNKRVIEWRQSNTKIMFKMKVFDIVEYSLFVNEDNIVIRLIYSDTYIMKLDVGKSWPELFILNHK